MPHPSRRTFLSAIPLSLTAAAMAARAAQPETPGAPAIDPRYPRQDPDLVRDLVGASHRSEERVREIITMYPSMANAAWDWGFGDWETPLGAAAHTGRRAIAEFLLERGARIDIFAAAMLGHLDTVKALLHAAPALARTRGPHGITLLAHARAGGEPATAVADYLATLPDCDLAETDLPISDAERDSLLGRYSFGPADSDCFEIKQARTLQIQRPGHSARPLKRTGETEFSPSGTPGVTIRFTGDTLTILDGPGRLIAHRR